MRAVLPGALQPGERFLDIQRQVKLDRPVIDRQRLDGHTRQLQRLRRRVLQREEHLEQRRVAGAALRLQGFDHLLKRQILVLVCAQGRLAYPLEQLQERRGARKVDAQRQAVDQQADQGLAGRLVAVGHRHADDHVLLAGIAPQQGGIGSQQGHEQGRPRLPAQAVQPFGERPPHLEMQRRPGGALHLWAGIIGQQPQDGWGAGKALLPVGHQSLQGFALQHLALPAGVIAILDDQLIQGRSPARRAGGI